MVYSLRTSQLQVKVSVMTVIFTSCVFSQTDCSLEQITFNGKCLRTENFDYPSASS